MSGGEGGKRGQQPGAVAAARPARALEEWKRVQAACGLMPTHGLMHSHVFQPRSALLPPRRASLPCSDPNGAMLAFADMMRKQIVMPAHLMDDGRHGELNNGRNLFEDFSGGCGLCCRYSRCRLPAGAPAWAAVATAGVRCCRPSTTPCCPSRTHPRPSCGPCRGGRGAGRVHRHRLLQDHGAPDPEVGGWWWGGGGAGRPHTAAEPTDRTPARAVPATGGGSQT